MITYHQFKHPLISDRHLKTAADIRNRSGIEIFSYLFVGPIPHDESCRPAVGSRLIMLTACKPGLDEMKLTLSLNS